MNFSDGGVIDPNGLGDADPEMCYIENCWGLLSRALNDGGRQIDTVDDLKEALVFSG